MERQESTPLEGPIYEASSSSTSPHKGDYGGGTQKPKINDHDVFLSCKETSHSKSFSDDLHISLVDAGIDTFYSKHQSGQEIDLGILDNLRQSKISIPIFSPYYAFSESGLRELVHMVKCKGSGQIVLPIFYGVRPSEVQHVEGGRSGRAFSGYERRVDNKELQEWKNALVEVGSLRGWATEKFAYGNDGALIKLIVTRVVSLLKRTFKLPKELVGIDDRVKHIMSSINPFNDKRIIGISGKRGSGKTALAKVLWNNLSSDFEYLSFVPNIREVSLHMDIEYLQEELICDILRTPHTVSNVDEGIGIIKSQFASKKVLVIFDDMDDDVHLNALIGDGSWLKAGSTVIITTRKVGILDKAKADPQSKLDELTEIQALTLFSRHLFGKDSPPEAYEDISKDVLLYIPKIPLILELIGSSFRRRREEVWKDTFMKLKDDVKNKNDPNVQHITYEYLDYEQQQIFLDIACLFIGSSKQNPIYMWDSCGFLPKKGIEALKRQGLIEIDKDDKLTMHDRLSNLGRKIVHLEDEKGLRQRSRLWIYEEALQVLDRNEGTHMIQAICLDEYDSEKSYTCENFKGLTNLRFLKVCGANFNGDFKNTLSELRWLHWERCPSNFVAANFHPKQLVVLNLSQSEISEDWEGWGPIKMATKLKVLNLSRCSPLKRTPDLTAFESLEILILEKCENLEKIHHSIGTNKSLISLNVNGCGRLDELPSGVGRLEELTVLLINDTAIREIPMSGKGLMKLETLNASCCGKLEKLPAGVAKMKKLRELLINDTAIREIPISRRGLKELRILSASGCRSLKELPIGVGSMRELRELLINDTTIQKIPMSKKGLKNLQTLSASGCRNLEELPIRVGNKNELRELLINDTAIQKIPMSKGGLKKLKTLHASNCEELAQLPKSMGFLVSLSNLNLSHSGIEEFPESMVFPKSLTLLDLSYSWIEKLPKSLDSLVSLNELDLSHSGIREFPKFRKSMQSLTQLDLSHTGIEELPESMGSLKALTYLNLSYLGIKKLPESMGDHVSLQHLLLQGCYLLRHLPNSIRRLTSLTKLDLQSTGIVELPHDMQNLKNLKVLDIRETDITRLPIQFNFALHDREISWELM